jgi:hypothetical protein
MRLIFSEQAWEDYLNIRPATSRRYFKGCLRL